MTLRDFQQDFNKNLTKNFNKIASAIEEIAIQVADEIPSPRAKRLLNSALDLVRPHFISLGLRIVKLSPHRVEVLVPAKFRNLDENGRILEGVLTSAGLEAYKLLWKANAPKGIFDIKIHSFTFEKVKELKGDIRVRSELSDLSREAVLAELNKDKRSHFEILLHFFNSEEQICAELNLKSELFLKEMIDWK